MANREGEQLGNYCLGRLLGRGGFAEVYLGEHVYLKTPGAIKLLHTTGANQKHLEGFLREAQAIAQLVHPHIVRVLEFGLDGETPFLVMDHAPNGTLRQRYPRKTQLALTTILPYVRQVSAALQYAHDAKIIHRDIKPENMLLGRGNEVLLSDFGIALLAQSSSSLSTQEVAGTAAYMAPEQFQGKPRLASDQYALGLVVYEWLTGDLPFHGSFIELCTQHLFTPPPPLHEKVPTLSPGVEQVILRALAKAPRDRYASVEEFAKELERAAVSSHPTSVTTVELPRTSTRPQAHQETPPRTPRRIVLKPAMISSHPASMTIAELPRTPMPLQARQEAPRHTPRPAQASTDEPGTSQFSRKEELPQDSFGEATHADIFSQIAVPDVQGHMPSVQSPLMPATGWRKRRVVLVTLLCLALVALGPLLAIYRILPGQQQPTLQPTTLTPLPTQTPDEVYKQYTSGTPIQTDLRSDNPTWKWINSGLRYGECNFSQGTFNVIPRPGSFASCVASNQRLTTFAFQVDVSIQSGDAAGIVVNDQPTTPYRTYDGFLFCRDTSKNDCKTAEVWFTHAEAGGAGCVTDFDCNKTYPSFIDTSSGGKNTLTVIALSSTIYLYINGHSVGVVPRSSAEIGGIGVAAFEDRNPTDAIFQNAKLWKLSK